LETYKLKAIGQSYTITGLNASNSTAGSSITPSFGGLTNGQVIAAGNTVTFYLLIPRPSSGRASLSYDFSVVETGQTFHSGISGTFSVQ
jgi:hypothetical protein